VSRTDHGVVFDFLGYKPQANGVTTLAIRVKNTQRLALDALGFTNVGWQRATLLDSSTYTGSLGVYQVGWVLDRVLPNLPAGALWARFLPQGTWLQQGASETFVITARTFDARQPLVAWARVNLQLAVLQVRPADFPCLIPPPPSTPTPPFSPLPKPPPTPRR
jgi:hypothetical protein